MPRRSAAAATTLHGVFMHVQGAGVLLTGASGVGKSELALELLSRGHRLIADDATEFSIERGRVHGRCPPLLRGFIEVRSLGILNVGRLYGPRSILDSAVLNLVIALELPGTLPETGIERLSGHRSERLILDIPIPAISIPVRLGHNLAVLVETACRDDRLRRLGYHADLDLTHRQSLEIRKQGRRKPTGKTT